MLRIFAPQAIEDRSKLYVLPGGEYDEESECYGAHNNQNTAHVLDFIRAIGAHHDLSRNNTARI